MLEVNELMTQKEVAQYLQICITCVRRAGIPSVKIGRSIRYVKSDVDLWLETKKQGGKNE